MFLKKKKKKRNFFKFLYKRMKILIINAYSIGSRKHKDFK